MRNLSAQQLAAYLKTARPLLVDVREPWEFDLCHIEGSVNIPMGQIMHELGQIDAADETVVICHHGIRSQQVIRYLEQQSVENLINLEGGVDAWAREVDLEMALY